ncbi:MAG: DUF3800 domain-containing protein [Candidatus Omnitrophota bacterium]|nr:DUF3800 domain-containing protein [Candidatus Omnitrophota bacterium]
MYLFYVDESGDSGLVGSPTNYYALSGFVVHELRWHQILEEIINFRKSLRARYGLKLRQEIHAADFIHSSGGSTGIPKSLRLRLMRAVLDFQAGLSDINVINVVVDKRTKPVGADVVDIAWTTLIQRFHNTISYRNFPGPQNPQDFGIIIADQTDVKKLMAISRRMRRFNPVPNMANPGSRNILIDTIVEDVVHRDSVHSYFIQLVDVNVYFLMQKHKACAYVKKKGASNYFDRLDPVLCKVASRGNQWGIVYR